MSRGDFTDAFYETDSGEICKVRVQPETLAATIGGTANASATGPATQLASAIVRKGKRQIGVGCRLVGIKWDTPPTDYTGEIAYIPVMSPTLFNSLSGGEAVTYNGGSGTVISFIAETRR